MTIPTRSTGFTLIEIMIAVAIIAVLAGIAMPAYSGYTIRSKVSECLVLSSGPKLEVSERRARGATSFTGVAGNFSGTRYCADIAVGEGGEIVMTTQATGARVDPVLQLTPDGVGEGGWSCGYLQGDPKYLPANCRSEAVAAVAAPAPGVPAPGTPSSPPVIDPFPSNPNPPPAPPSPVEPAPVDPSPTPDPSEPAPTDPVPADPVPPINPSPSEPPPSDPAPSDPSPADPVPPAPGPGPGGPGGPGTDPDPEPIDDGKPGSRSWCQAHPNPPAVHCGWMGNNP